MRNLDLFWASNRDWYEWTENGDRVLKETAPQEAKESYARYIKQKKIAAERAEKFNLMD